MPDTLSQLSTEIGELKAHTATQGQINERLLNSNERVIDELRKISERIGTIGEMKAEFGQYRGTLHERFNNIHQQFGDVDLSLDKLEKTLDTVVLKTETQLAQVALKADDRLGIMERSFVDLNAKLRTSMWWAIAIASVIGSLLGYFGPLLLHGAVK